jgi:hypothetical protein
VDFNLHLLPIPNPNDSSSILSDLDRETSWANKMTWICASVVHYCFDGVELEPTSRMRQYREQWDSIEKWDKERPSSFSPIWAGPPREHGVFPEIWFTADWHGKHLCSVTDIMLSDHMLQLWHMVYIIFLAFF